MRTKVLTTALGDFCAIHPLGSPKNMTEEWGCSHFDKNGQWHSTGIYPNKEAAQSARTRTFTNHRLLAKIEKLKRGE